MSIKQLVLFGGVGIVVILIIAAFITVLPDRKDTAPTVTIEQLDNQLKTIQSDNDSGLISLQEKQETLATLETERQTLEARLR